MNKKELTRKAAEVLRKSSARKTVSLPRQVFHISDDNGNQKDFIVKKADKEVLYTIDDVAIILDALIFAIKESLKVGDPVTIHGFGTFGLRYRKPRQTKQLGTDDTITIDGRFVPKFSFGNDLRLCAKIYEMSFDDRMKVPDLPEEDFEYEEEDGDIDGV